MAEAIFDLVGGTPGDRFRNRPIGGREIVRRHLISPHHPTRHEIRCRPAGQRQHTVAEEGWSARGVNIAAIDRTRHILDQGAILRLAFLDLAVQLVMVQGDFHGDGQLARIHRLDQVAVGAGGDGLIGLPGVGIGGEVDDGNVTGVLNASRRLDSADDAGQSDVHQDQVRGMGHHRCQHRLAGGEWWRGLIAELAQDILQVRRDDRVILDDQDAPC